VSLRWWVGRWEPDSRLELALTVPPGFTPLGVSTGTFDPLSRTLTITLFSSQGELSFSTPASQSGPLQVTARLRRAGIELASSSLRIPEEGLAIVNPPGGQASGFSGRVRVSFPPGALAGGVAVRVRRPSFETYPPTTLSGQPFEVEVHSRADNREISRLGQPLLIQVAYDEQTLRGAEDSLSLFYYSEIYQEWRPLLSWIDARRNLLFARTDRLAVFDYDTSNWQAASLPGSESFQAAQFTGAATYSYPLWAPPGPGGLQPELELSYNSQVVDNATAQSQASWVGMGWSLETGYIERDMHGSDNDPSDDSFSLVMDGARHRLLPGADGYYHTLNENHWRINYNRIADTWTVWDKTGKKYFFADQAKFPTFIPAGQGWQKSGEATWRWALSGVQNNFGRELRYVNKIDSQRYLYLDSSGAPASAPVDIAIYPEAIEYPNDRYRLYFYSTMSRSDYDIDWGANVYSKAFYQRYLLNEVRVEHNPDGVWGNGDEEVVRRYVLTYDPTHPIFPYLAWSAGGKTPALQQVQEFGRDASALPATSFTYGDGAHLTGVENGYGARIEFSYQAWYDLSSAPEHSLEQRFGWWGNACNDGPDDTGGWVPRDRSSVVSCASAPGDLLVKGEAKHVLRAHLVRPGGWYRSYAKVKSAAGGSTVFQAGVAGKPAGDDHYAQPIAIDSRPYSSTPAQAFQIALDSTQALGLLKCADVVNGCKVDLAWIGMLPFRYRVSSRTVTDLSTNEGATFSYRYDEPASNDSLHSAGADSSLPYMPPYAEFRGHAQVAEVGPDGRVTTTWFYQDDAKKGLAHTTLVASEEFHDGFNAGKIDDAQWTPVIGAAPLADRWRGDYALKLVEDSTWGGVQRSSPALSEGEAVVTQFMLGSGSGEAILAWEVGTCCGAGYYRRGVYVKEDGTLVTSIYDNGIPLDETLLLSSAQFARDAWYTLLMVVDDDLYVRIWKRDNPILISEQEIALRQNPFAEWRFKLMAKSGSIWLDEYSEARLFTLEENQYSVTQIDAGTLPARGGQAFTDLGINWVSNSQLTRKSYEGDGSWTGRRWHYLYLASDQDGMQYGNLTRQRELFYNGSTWTFYRAARWLYHPAINTTRYLVGLPGSLSRFRCPDGSCDYEAQDLMALSEYLYDGSPSHSTPPSIGKLTGERTLLRCDDAACAVPYYSDVNYAYDTWGNRITLTRYTGEGTASTPHQGEAQTATTTYDPVYHTYALEERNALGHSTSWIYDYGLGLPISESDPNGALTQARYDGFGRLIKLWRPGDSETWPTLKVGYFDWYYANNGVPAMVELWQKVSANDWNQYSIQRHFYDGLGRLVQDQTNDAELASGVREVLVDYDYDAYGRLVQQTAPYEVMATDGTGGTPYRGRDLTRDSAFSAYDLLGRQTMIWGAGVITATHSYHDLETWTTDARGLTTVTSYDRLGRVSAVDPPAGPGVTYAYDQLDRLTGAAYGDYTARLTYDMAGRKLSIVDPERGVWSYGYDALGNLVKQQDARDRVLCLYYDLLNRLVGKYYLDSGAACPASPSMTVSYAYDEGANGKGRRTSMAYTSNGTSGAAAWTYDSRGRLTSEVGIIDKEMFTTQWGYNSADLLSWMRYPGDDRGGAGEQLNYSYLRQLALDGIANTDPFTYVQNTGYDAAGRVNLRILGENLLRTDYIYNAWTAQGGRLRQIRSGTLANPYALQRLEYTWDPNGNLTQVIDYNAGGIQTQTFGYDAADRLISAAISGAGQGGYAEETYTYDPATGDLSSKGGVSLTYGDMANGRAVTYTSDGSSFEYDANGDMIRRRFGGSSYTLTYDHENRLVRVSGAVTAEFAYDGDGNMVKAAVDGVTTYYVGDYFEWSGSTSSMVKYYYADGQRIAMREGAAGALYWLFSDHMGSTTVAADSRGDKVGELRYTPWGELRYTWGTTPTRYRFAGQRQEALLGGPDGLYFNNTRWYDAATGRFIQASPSLPATASPWPSNFPGLFAQISGLPYCSSMTPQPGMAPHTRMLTCLPWVRFSNCAQQASSSKSRWLSPYCSCSASVTGR